MLARDHRLVKAKGNSVKLGSASREKVTLCDHTFSELTTSNDAKDIVLICSLQPVSLVPIGQHLPLGKMSRDLLQN